jgi:MGT family glycosyltransferase
VSARFLFACWPFEGHVAPQLGIAAELHARGHEVGIYTAAGAVPAVEAEGFAAFSFSAVAEAWEPVHARDARMGGRRQSLRVQREAFSHWLVETIPHQVADLRAAMESWQPDVLVTESSMWGPLVILWEADRIPVAMSSTFMGPMIPGPDAPPWGLGLAPARTPASRAVAWTVQRITDVAARAIRTRVDVLRAEHGLGPLGCSINEFTGRLPLHLVGNVRELDYDRHDLPAAVHYVGPCSRRPDDGGATETWLARIPTDRPWVHVTEGTSHYKRAFLLEAAARGLAGGQWEAILTTGTNRRLTLPAAPNVHSARWLDHAQLLARCAAMVTTGGAGAVIEAAAAGVPLVVVPTDWDKPDNARRVVEAGLGLRISPRRCSPATLRAAVEEILLDPAYRTAARRMAALIGDAPGPSGAADLLGELVPAYAQGGRP